MAGETKNPQQCYSTHCRWSSLFLKVMLRAHMFICLSSLTSWKPATYKWVRTLSQCQSHNYARQTRSITSQFFHFSASSAPGNICVSCRTLVLSNCHSTLSPVMLERTHSPVLLFPLPSLAPTNQPTSTCPLSNCLCAIPSACSNCAFFPISYPVCKFWTYSKPMFSPHTIPYVSVCISLNTYEYTPCLTFDLVFLSKNLKSISLWQHALRMCLSTHP